MSRIPLSEEDEDPFLDWDGEGELDFNQIQVREFFFEQDSDLADDDLDDEDPLHEYEENLT